MESCTLTFSVNGFESFNAYSDSPRSDNKFAKFFDKWYAISSMFESVGYTDQKNFLALARVFGLCHVFLDVAVSLMHLT